MKRAIMIVCTAAVVAVWGSAASADDFDSYPVGDPPVPPWNEHYAGWGGTPVYTRGEAAALGVSIEVTNAVSISGNSLHFLDTSEGVGSSVGSSLSRNFTPASSVVAEYYMRTDNSAYEGAFVLLGGDVGGDYEVAFSNGAFGGQAGYIGVHGSPAGWVKPDLLPYNENTWYYVRRELNTVADTGLFYVEEMGNPSNNASYSIGRNHSNSYMDKITVWTSNSQGADAYIDELTVVPEPATLLLLSLGGLALVRRRLVGSKLFSEDRKRGECK